MAFEFCIVFESRILKSIVQFCIVLESRILKSFCRKYELISKNIGVFLMQIPQNFSLSLLTFLSEATKPHYPLNYLYGCFEALFSMKPKINKRT